MTRIAVVSDTHLAARATGFNANWQRARDWIAATAPDRVIHLGDVSAAGDERIDDLHFAAQALTGLGRPLHLLPGNHDLGDNPVSTGQTTPLTVTAERLARYRAVFGADYWTLDIDGWQLIGLNAQLLGTGGDEEADQLRWLAANLSKHRQLPIGLLLHKPLFRDGPADDEPGERYVPTPVRKRLLDLLADHDLRFVISGHTHQARQFRADGIDHVWVPSTSFCIPDAVQEPIGRKCVGCLMLTLDGDSPRFETVTPPGMQRHNLLDQAEVYPQVIGPRTRLGPAAAL